MEEKMNLDTHKRYKVLIIDDEQDICFFMKSILERTGKYEVSVSISSVEGLMLAKSFHPDMILLDIMMPVMDGSEVAARLHEDPETENILIVFVSALAKPQDLKESEGKIGGHPFIVKPIYKDELLARLDALLQEKEGRRDAK